MGCRLILVIRGPNVAFTDVTVTDTPMTGAIHGDLAGGNLAPGRHYLDITMIKRQPFTVMAGSGRAGSGTW